MRIEITDDIKWEDYKQKVDEIMCSNELLTVTWDVSKMTTIPWHYIHKQIELMVYYKLEMSLHIKNNIIILPNKKWIKLLEFIFSIIPPIVPLTLKMRAKFEAIE